MAVVLCFKSGISPVFVYLKENSYSYMHFDIRTLIVNKWVICKEQK